MTSGAGILTDDRAVSSTVSVAFLIAIAVILAIVPSVFAFDALNRNIGEAPRVVVELDYDESANELTVTHQIGTSFKMRRRGSIALVASSY